MPCSPSSSIWPLSIPGLVFFLIQLELRRHPTNLAYISSRLRGRPIVPKSIRIHLTVSRVRFYLIRFNSSGNFCDGRAISSRGTPNPNPNQLYRLRDRAGYWHGASNCGCPSSQTEGLGARHPRETVDCRDKEVSAKRGLM